MSFVYEGAVSSGAVGGARNHFRGMARALDNANVERMAVVVPAFRGESTLDLGLSDRCRIYRVPALRRGLRGHVTYELLKLVVVLWIRLQDVARREATTLMSRVTPVGLVPQVARLTGARVVLEVNGLPDSEFVARGFSDPVVKGVRTLTNSQLRMATHVVAVTEGLAELVRLRSSAFVLRLENGVDLADVPLKDLSRGAKHTVAYSGAFAPWQELDILISACADLITADPEAGWRLLLIGDGEMRETLEGLAAQLGIPGSVEITGWLERADAVSRLLDARIAVVPLRPKDQTGVCGSPLKLFEYLAVGRSVVASNIDGVVELDYPVHVYQQGDTADLARALKAASIDTVASSELDNLRAALAWDERASRLIAFLDASPSLSR